VFDIRYSSLPAEIFAYCERGCGKLFLQKPPETVYCTMLHQESKVDCTDSLLTVDVQETDGQLSNRTRCVRSNLVDRLLDAVRRAHAHREC